MANTQAIADMPRELRDNVGELTSVFEAWASAGEGNCVLLSAPLDRGRSLLWRSILRGVASKHADMPAPIIVDAATPLPSVAAAHRLVATAKRLSPESRDALSVACKVMLKKSNFAPFLVELLVRLAIQVPAVAKMISQQAASPPPLDMAATVSLLDQALERIAAGGRQCIVLENIERAGRAELLHSLPQLHTQSTRQAAPDGLLILVTYGSEVHLSQVARQIIHKIGSREGAHQIEMAPISRSHILGQTGPMDDAIVDELVALSDGSLRSFMTIWKELPKSDLIARDPDGRWIPGSVAPQGIRAKMAEAIADMLTDEPRAQHARRALLMAAQQGPTHTAEVVATALWTLGHRLADTRPEHDAAILTLMRKRFAAIMKPTGGDGMASRFSFTYPLLQLHLQLATREEDTHGEYRIALAMALEEHCPKQDYSSAWRAIALYHAMGTPIGDARARQLRTRLQAPPSPEGRHWEVPVTVDFMRQHLDPTAFLQWLLRFVWQNRYLYPHPDITASLTAAAPIATDLGDPALIAELHLVTSRIHLLYADFAAADTAARSSLETATASLTPLEQGRARIVLGQICLGRHQFAEAVEPLMQAMQMLDEIQGDGPDTARALSALALSYGYRGDYERAEDLLNRALGIQQDQLGTAPDTADSLNYLGLLHHLRDNHSMAESNYAYALTMRQKILGYHPETASSLNNLGSLYIDREDLDKAESHLRRALSIQIELLGDHPDAAVTLCNLAALYMSRSDTTMAQECATRALGIQMKHLGEHPLTASSLYLVGGILAARSETKSAEASAWQGIRMLEAIDPLHPDIPVFLRSYAYLLRRMSRGMEANNWDELADERETEIARRIRHMD